MLNWRSVTTWGKLNTLSHQLLKSINNDLSLLTQSQLDMLAAIDIKNGVLTFEEAKATYGSAKSSLNFARSNLRFFSPQFNAAALLGMISIHNIDKLRRRFGTSIEGRILRLSDEEIINKYRYRSLQTNKKPIVPLPNVMVSSGTLQSALTILTTAVDLSHAGDQEGATRLAIMVRESLELTV